MTPIEEWIKQEATKNALELFNAWTEKDEYKAFEDGWKSGATAMQQKMQGEIMEMKKEVEKWKDEYTAMETIISEYQNSDNIKDKEIDRLKKLIEKTYINSWRDALQKNTLMERWQKFKSENNL